MGAWALAGPRQALWEREEPSPEADLRCRSWSAPAPATPPLRGGPQPLAGLPQRPQGSLGRRWRVLGALQRTVELCSPQCWFTVQPGGACLAESFFSCVKTGLMMPEPKSFWPVQTYDLRRDLGSDWPVLSVPLVLTGIFNDLRGWNEPGKENGFAELCERDCSLGIPFSPKSP